MSDPVSLFVRAKEAEAAADLETMLDVFAADAVMYEPYQAGTKSGPEVAQYLGTVCGTEFAALEFSLIGAVVDGDRAAIELEEVVTTSDDKHVSIRNCTIVECRDGKIVRWYEYLQPMRRRP